MGREHYWKGDVGNLSQADLTRIKANPKLSGKRISRPVNVRRDERLRDESYVSVVVRKCSDCGLDFIEFIDKHVPESVSKRTTDSKLEVGCVWVVNRLSHLVIAILELRYHEVICVLEYAC